MSPPVIELSSSDRELGSWMTGTRRLRISASFARRATWGEVVRVLEHEMAHQYVDEILGITGETAHGPTFRAVCRDRGIDARAHGEPEADDPVSAVVRRIQKLLALAESPVEAEARSAARAAQRLMRKHNIQLADQGGERDYEVAQVGELKTRRPAHEQLLAGILASHFFVDVTSMIAYRDAEGKNWRMFEIAGTQENVEIAGWVWDYLLQTAERLWVQHRDAKGLKGNRERRRFIEGLMWGFRDKMDADAKSMEQEEGLVWVGDPGLEDFAQRRYPHRRSGRSISVRTDGAHAAGRAAGRQLTLRKPIKDKGTGVAGRIGMRKS